MTTSEPTPTRAFFEVLGDASLGDAHRSEMGRVLEEAVRAAETAWPELQLNTEVFVTHLARCIEPEGDALEQLRRMSVTDLYLAFACSLGNSRAIATLERVYARQIQMAIKRLRNRHLLPEDFRQILRRRLFVGEPGRDPIIARYSGKGTLGAWIRVTALRTALNATRGSRPVEEGLPAEEDLFNFEASPEDPELDHLKRSYRAAFREAFLDTVETLPARDKTLLRQSVVHGLSVREIARMHDVHHATVARWVAHARELLLDGTRRTLANRLGVSSRELDSIMGLIESRLDVSVARALGTD